MVFVVISSPNKSKSEIRHIVEFFDNGLDFFHVKKKGFTKSKMEEYLSAIPKKYRNKIVLHSHYFLAKKYGLRGIHISRHKKRKKYMSDVHYYIAKVFAGNLKISKSYHSIHSLVHDKKKYDYVFLSPVFDSHNIGVFSASFSEKQLRSVLYKTHHNVVALGGVTTDRVEVARRSGFDGVALHSTIWREKNDRLAKLIEVKKEVDRTTKEIN
jgi:thiamine-phosphate pyrophosphorylase